MTDHSTGHSSAITPFTAPAWITRTQEILNSYARWTGKELVPRSGHPAEESERLYRAPFVLVAHGTEADPVLNYGNDTALRLWEMDLPRFLQTPSRQTAEPVHRDERARMLEQTRQRGYFDDYRGIRIAAGGRKFWINQATVWNVLAADGTPAGQAATFSTWEFLPVG